jgi:hypothetical protein
MDEDRKIRFEVAPILFIASLLLGALINKGLHSVVDDLEKLGTSKLIGIIAGGGVIVLAAGYVIGTFTHFLLRQFFLWRPRSWGKSRFHEVALSDNPFKWIWERVGAPPGKSDPEQQLFAGVAFDHGVLRKDWEGVHQWLLRRWNGFNTAANSILALLLALLVGPSIGVPWGYWWCLSVVAFMGVLGFVAFRAWHDTMNMLDFMANLEKKPTPGETPGLTDGG